MRRLIMVLLGIVFFARISLADANERLPAKFQLPGVYKGAIAQDDLKGRFVLMQFWASWCTSCSSLMIQMQEFAEEHKAQNLKFVTVSVDEELSAAKSYFEHLPADFKSLADFAYFDKAGDFAEKLRVKAIPSIMLISSSGEIVMQLTGHPNSSQIKDMERMLVKK